MIPKPPLDRRLAVAPMIDWTDRHERVFLRGLTKRTLLYTEMITTGALLRGDRARHLDFSPLERPLALQIGGSDSQALAHCARMGADWGYDEINLNVGCPSDRVSAGRFGACLMAEPHVVAEAVAAMRAATTLPVTVKHRLGIDDLDAYEDVHRFVTMVASAGVTVFIVHARKAWLTGLSPKENREIPPLRYDWVERLTQDFPTLSFILNGGIKTLAHVQEHNQRFVGCMIGRAAYETPYTLAEADRVIFDDATAPPPTREQVVERFLPYVENQLSHGTPLQAMTRHILGLFHGEAGARDWRRHISEHAHRPNAGLDVIENALKARHRS